MTFFTSSGSILGLEQPNQPQTDEAERDAIRVLNAVSGLGNRRITKLIGHFGSARAVIAADTPTLNATGLPQSVVINLRNFPVEEFLVKDNACLLRTGSRFVTLGDDEYPEQLKNIPDAPVVLYLKGRWPQNLSCSLAIVGSRHPSLYGIQLAERFSIELAELGCVIVSGLAKGIDAAAHKGALKAGGGTIGVLGCGLDIVYPADNAELFRQMETHGLILSEFPFGTIPSPFNFPRRNRVVSGLSLGVLVIEARVRSGALITARFAAEQGRDVMAVPGRIDSKLSEGPHALIRQGAKLVMTLDDIIEELPVKIEKVGGTPQQTEDQSAADLDEAELALWELIKEESLSLDQLELRTGLSVSSLMGPLLSLQIKRRIKELPGKVYQVIM